MKRAKLGIFAVFLSAALFAPACLSVSAEGGHDYDYARAGDVGAVTYTAVDLLAKLGITPSEEERDYLLEKGLFTLRYSPALSAGAASVNFEDGELTVDVSPVFYTAKNGQTVVWTPLTVDGGGTLSGDALHYETTPAEGKDSVTVRFGSTLTVAAEDVNAVLTAAYDAGMGAAEKLAEKERAYAEEKRTYDASVAAYEAYQSALTAYEEDLEEYHIYQNALALWREQDEAYRNYLERYEAYLEEQRTYYDFNSVLSEYRAKKAEYDRYLEDYADYERRYEDYLASLDSEEARGQLARLKILDYLTTPSTSLQRTLYSAITGSAVSFVLDMKETLVRYNLVDKKVIDRTEEVTRRLRNELAALEACTTDRDRYIYYKTYYTTLRDDFCDLFRCLDYMYQNPNFSVHGPIHDRTENDQNRKFWILLAQLYYFCNAITDGQVSTYNIKYNFGYKEKYPYRYFDSSYRIDGKTPAEILENDPAALLQDGENAAPPESGYLLPEPPEPPEPVEDPGEAPNRPSSPPIAPREVTPPGPEPELVLEPVRPQEVPMPAGEPRKYTPTAEESALKAAYDAGKFSDRKASLRKEDFLWEVETSVDRYFRNARTVVVEYYDGERLLGTDDVMRGDFLTPTVAEPTREETGYTYTFAGWNDGTGAPFDLTKAIDTDAATIRLYARFTRTPNLYDVIWEVDGAIRQGKAAYRSVPAYDGAMGPLVKERAGVRKYFFLGWRDEAGNFYPAEEDGSAALPEMGLLTVRYSAVFEGSAEVTFVLRGESITLAVRGGERPVCPLDTSSVYDRNYFYEFLGWEGEEGVYAPDELPLAEADGTARYTASLRRTPLAGYGDLAGDVVLENGYYTATCATGSPQSFRLGALFVIAAKGGAGIRVRTAGCTMILDSGAVKTAAEAGADELLLRAVRMADRSEFYFGLGEGLSVDAVLRITGDFAGYRLLEEDGAGALSFCGFDREGERQVSFAVRAGCRYEMCPFYTLSPAEEGYPLTIETGLPLLDIGGLLLVQARAGDEVFLRLGEPASGKQIAGVSAVEEVSGAPIVLEEREGGYAFRMPAADILVTVRTADILYTVRFYAEGVLLYEAQVPYGTDLTELAPPAMKPADNTAVYRFTGWDVPLAPVTGDAEYHAVFAAEELPPAQGPSRTAQLINLLSLVLPIAAAVLVVAAAGLTVFLVLRRRKKRKGAQAAADTAAETPAPDMDTAKEVTSDMDTAEEPASDMDGVEEATETPEMQEEPIETTEEVVEAPEEVPEAEEGEVSKTDDIPPELEEEGEKTDDIPPESPQ